MTENEIRLAQENRELRIDYGISLAPVAFLVGRSRSWLYRVETGKIRANRRTLRKIREAIRRIARPRRRRIYDLRLKPRAKPTAGLVGF